MACAINGTPVTKTFSGTNTGAFAALTTTVANCIVVVVVATEKLSTAVQTVSSITDTAGLSWAKRSSKAETNQQNLEVWWAAMPTAGANTITVNVSGNVDDAAMIAFAVSGCASMTTPWDTNVAIPTTGGAASTQDTVTGVSTTQTNDMVLMFCSNYSGVNYTGHQGSGYTQVTVANNAGGSRFSNLQVQYQLVTAPQSGITVSVDNALSSHSWVAIADALTSDANLRSAAAAQTIPDFSQTATLSSPQTVASQIINDFPNRVPRLGNFVRATHRQVDPRVFTVGARPRRVR